MLSQIWIWGVSGLNQHTGVLVLHGDGFAQVIVLPLGRIVTMGRSMFLVSQQSLGRRFVSKQHPHVCQEPRLPSRAVLVMKLELFSSPVTDFNIGADWYCLKLFSTDYCSSIQPALEAAQSLVVFKGFLQSQEDSQQPELWEQLAAKELKGSGTLVLMFNRHEMHLTVCSP